jgi:CubicO group peptidase (beta-lactamase class C family)
MMAVKFVKQDFLILILAIFFLIILGSRLVAQDAKHSEISELVEAEAKYALFTGTVLVAKNGNIIYTGAFGEENKEYSIPITLETKFNISSVQKSFIATIVMQLYQEGKIDLDDPLTKFYPDCPYETANQIKIKHLLNHTSGLEDYRGIEGYQQLAESFTCIDDVIPFAYKDIPKFPAGEKFQYSNSGVLYLKGIIEKVTGMKLKQALQQRIWKPLGMENTTLYVGGDLLENRATAYTLTDNCESYVRVTGEPSAYAGGGIYTTVLDLLKFDQTFYGEKLLNKKTKQIMFTPVEVSPNYAYGWIVMPFEGTTLIFHSGGSGGFNAEFQRFPDLGYTVIVLSNDEDAAYYLSNKIDRLLLDQPYSLATEQDTNHKYGLHCQNNKYYKKALTYFEKNAQGKEPYMASLYQIARTRILGEFEQEKAIEVLDRYIKLADESTRPSIAAAWWRKGVAYEQLGNIMKAIKCQKKSLVLDDSFEQAKKALERLMAEKD